MQTATVRIYNIPVFLSLSLLCFSRWKDFASAQLSSKNMYDSLCVICSQNAFLAFPLSQSWCEFIYSVFSNKQALHGVFYREQRTEAQIKYSSLLCLLECVFLYVWLIFFNLSLSASIALSWTLDVSSICKSKGFQAFRQSSSSLISWSRISSVRTLGFCYNGHCRKNHNADMLVCKRDE